METTSATQTSGVSAVNEADNSSSMAALGGLIAGEVVANYDQQVNDYKDELQDIADQKNEVRNDKVTSGNITPTETDFYVVADKDGKYSIAENENDANAEKAIVISIYQHMDLEELSEKYGVDLHCTGTAQGIVMSQKGYDDFMDKIISAMDSKLDSLNQSSELKMIQFQGIIDARKQALMQLSNMMSSNNQTIMSIIQNMKG